MMKLFFMLLQTWELAILAQLNWDVNLITAMDFVDLLLVRSSEFEPYPSSNKHGSIVRRHAITFIALCSTGRSSSNGNILILLNPKC